VLLQHLAKVLQDVLMLISNSNREAACCLLQQLAASAQSPLRGAPQQSEVRRQCAALPCSLVILAEASLEADMLRHARLLNNVTSVLKLSHCSAVPSCAHQVFLEETSLVDGLLCHAC
jgi:hypothetical protein